MSDLYTREIDLHGMSVIEARRYLKTTLNSLPKHITTLRVIHGCNQGSELMKMVQKEFGHKRIERKILELNRGVTTFLLR